MFAKRKAVLIQDVLDYIVAVRTHLRPILLEYGRLIENEESVLEWILREEIETVYVVNCLNHDHRAEPYRTIYNVLTNATHGRATAYFSSTVKVPRIFAFDTPVRVTLRGRDLYLIFEEQ